MGTREEQAEQEQLEQAQQQVQGTSRETQAVGEGETSTTPVIINKRPSDAQK